MVMGADVWDKANNKGQIDMINICVVIDTGEGEAAFSIFSL